MESPTIEHTSKFIIHRLLSIHKVINSVSVVVRIQMLAELEEIITYKQSYDNPVKQEIIHKTWMSRIEGCQRNVEVWQRILKVRALVISPKNDMIPWIKYANLCRKGGRLNLAYKSLHGLLSKPHKDFALLDTYDNPPSVVYACLKYLWSSGAKEQSLEQMKTLKNL